LSIGTGTTRDFAWRSFVSTPAPARYRIRPILTDQPLLPAIRKRITTGCRGCRRSRQPSLETMKLQRLLPIFILITVVGMRASDPPKAVVKESSFQFGKVMRGAVVEHEFAISNAGTQPLLITNVIMSTPLRVMRMPASIAPGSEASLKFSLD